MKRVSEYTPNAGAGGVFRLKVPQMSRTTSDRRRIEAGVYHYPHPATLERLLKGTPDPSAWQRYSGWDRDHDYGTLVVVAIETPYPDDAPTSKPNSPTPPAWVLLPYTLHAATHPAFTTRLRRDWPAFPSEAALAVAWHFRDATPNARQPLRLERDPEADAHHLAIQRRAADAIREERAKRAERRRNMWG